MTYDKLRNLRASAFLSSLQSGLTSNANNANTVINLIASGHVSGVRGLQDVANVDMMNQGILFTNANTNASYNATILADTASISLTTSLPIALSDTSVVLTPVLGSQLESMSLISQLLSLTQEELEALRESGVDVDALISIDNYIQGNAASTKTPLNLSSTSAPKDTTMIKPLSSKPTKKPVGLLSGGLLGIQGAGVSTEAVFPGLDTTVAPTRDIYVVGSTDASIASSLESGFVPTRDTFAGVTQSTDFSYPPIVLPSDDTMMNSSSGVRTTSNPNIPSFTIFTTTDASTLNLPTSSVRAQRFRNGSFGQVAGGISVLLMLMIF